MFHFQLLSTTTTAAFLPTASPRLPTGYPSCTTRPTGCTSCTTRPTGCTSCTTRPTGCTSCTTRPTGCTSCTTPDCPTGPALPIALSISPSKSFCSTALSPRINRSTALSTRINRSTALSTGCHPA